MKFSGGKGNSFGKTSFGSIPLKRSPAPPNLGEAIGPRKFNPSSNKADFKFIPQKGMNFKFTSPNNQNDSTSQGNESKPSIIDKKVEKTSLNKTEQVDAENQPNHSSNDNKPDFSSEKSHSNDFVKSKKTELFSNKSKPNTFGSLKKASWGEPKPKSAFSTAQNQRLSSRSSSSRQGKRITNWEALTGKSRESRERHVQREIKSAVFKSFGDEVSPEEAQEIAESLSLIICMQSEKLAETLIARHPHSRHQDSRALQRPPPGMVQVPTQQWEQMLQMSYSRDAQFNMLLQSNIQLMKRIKKLRDGDDDEEEEVYEEEEEEEEEEEDGKE